MQPTKKLYRSKNNQIFSGLLGGIGEYLAVDPVFVRLVFVVFLILTGVFPGLIIYIVALFIVPERPDAEVIHGDEPRVHDV